MYTEIISVFGIVQGVGFRPFVSRLARRLGLYGSVCNKGSYVEIILQGTAERRQQFQENLQKQAPERSAILAVHTEQAERPPYTDFAIIKSERERGDIFVSPDIAICDRCKEELFDRSNRRYLHPFINCTACGPRMTILDSMPYDRERTSMGEFPMCPACRTEYEDPLSRRYDAQPVCCNDCGPEVYLLGRTERRHAAITEARRILSSGGIVAVKGIGGFHLCCDGTNEAAVQRLRRLKGRPVKPLAVMMKDLSVAARECVLTTEEEAVLDGPQKSILLLHRRHGGQLCPSVAPGNPKVGVMLPYAPLQLLLFTYDDGLTMPDCLVMTSANASGAPICRTDDDAAAELTNLCDAILSHNRRILLRADDSVMDWYDGRPYMIRRSRGYAPLPFFVGKPTKKADILAVGG
ncbi:Sua5/YciO/YrdC/YwlC family protein, partial [uncultured Megasphaera sp.]|uniref:Sua5/YciO/YrdC/YwlC family protein n=1 Tax=uncultured Megasphaera sp. TaxID=165188 RepID=UPI002659C692